MNAHDHESHAPTGGAMVDERELHALFAARRPDAAAFAAAVAAKTQGRRQPSRRLREAAAWLPLDLVVPFQGRVAAWLTLPSALLVGAWLSFGAALRSIRRSAAAVAPLPSPRWSPWLGSLGALLLYGLMIAAVRLGDRFGVVDLGDHLLLVVAASMGALAWSLRIAAREGVLTRQQAARIGMAMLTALFVLSIFHGLGAVPGATHDWAFLSLPLLAAGMFALVPAAGRAFALEPVLLVGATLAVIVATGVGRSLRTPTLDDMAAAVASAGSTADLGDWIELPSFVALLREQGRAIEVPPAVRQACEAAAAHGGEHELHVLSAAARLGLFDDATWRRLAGRQPHAFALERLRTATGPLAPAAFEECQLAMLLATTPLADSARRRLGDRLAAALDAADGPFPLETARQCVRWLQHLGLNDVVAARREQLQAMLVRHQAKDGHGTGGFVAEPRTLPHESREATAAAIELMAAIGVPAGVDAPALHRHLARTSRLAPDLARNVLLHRLAAHRDRLRLEAMAGPIRRPILTVLREERTTLALLLVVALCLAAVWSVPRPFAAGRGAMP
jgi:hypothetical protein